MLSIGITIGDVCTDITTDQQMSFDAIETLLKRAVDSTLDAYSRYCIADEDLEAVQEDDE